MSTAARRRKRVAASLLAGFRFLVHSNLFISLAAASVVVTTVVLAGLSFDPLPVAIVFAVTLFVYTVNRFTDREEDAANVPRRAAFVERYGRVWLAAGVGAYLAAIGVALRLDLPGAGFLVLPLLVALAYSLGGIKRIFLVKNLFVGLAWTVIPLGVGFYYHHWTLEIYVLAVYVGVMITIAAVVFDVKDVEGDREQGIATVPSRFGARRTRIAAQAANVLVAAGVVAVVASGVLGREFLVLLAFQAYVGCYIPFATRDRGPLFYGGVVDGEHVFLAALVVALEWLVW